MNTLDRLSEQVRFFAEYHIPTEMSVPILLVGSITMIVIGLLTAVLGAKLARPSFAAGFGVVGAVVGCWVGDALDVPPLLAAAIGAVVLGISGFVLHRLWVGLATCVILIAVAAGSYGTHAVLPHFESYSTSVPEPIRYENHDFTTPDAAIQAMHLNPEFKQWAKGFWNDVTAQNASLKRNLILISASAGILGLLLGLVAVRFTLVILTSIIGTAMLTSGATSLAYHFQPELYQAGLQHPQVLGIACGTFLLGSVILQALLTRSNKPSQKAKDKA